MLTRRVLATFLVVGMATVPVGAARAMWARASDAPVDRLIANFERYIGEHPDDPDGYYRLGRVHSLAFSLETNVLQAYSDGEGGWSDVEWDWMWRPPKGGDDAENAPSREELVEHLRQGVISFNRAIEMDGSMPAYFLSLGSLLEAGRDHAGMLDVAPFVSGVEVTKESGWGLNIERITEERTYRNLIDAVHDAHTPRGSDRNTLVRDLLPLRASGDEAVRRAAAGLLKEDWLAQTKECYFNAFALALPGDSLRTEQPIRGVAALMTHEAGDSYLRMLRSPLPRADEKLRWKIVRRVLGAFDDLPKSNAITPIIFPIDGRGSLDDLIDIDASVGFDLDGTGREQAWPWVRPGAAILVWDPEHLGRITSGRQLFGSVTWWMLFDNGYLALDALDDDRDGRLTGEELLGIRVWVDQDSDAISDPGEVVDLDAFAITAISTRSTGTSHACPMNSSGIVRGDGTTLPTFDWIARPWGSVSPE